MKKIILLLFLSLSFVLEAQHDEAYVNRLTEEFTQELSDKGIEMFFVNRQYCSGNIEMFIIDGKMCTSKGTYFEVFVVWHEEGKDYMKKIDNCGLYQSIQLSDTKLTEFYQDEYPALINDEVKPYRSAAYTGEPELRKNVQPCFREFAFVKENRNDFKKFNLFAISNDSEGENLNYSFNQTLKLVELHQMLDNVIPSLIFKRAQ